MGDKKIHSAYPGQVCREKYVEKLVLTFVKYLVSRHLAEHHECQKLLATETETRRFNSPKFFVVSLLTYLCEHYRGRIFGLLNTCSISTWQIADSFRFQ